jgi:hypothetical protein
MSLYNVLKRIIRNDAIKVDPPEIYNMRIIALACSVNNIFSLHCNARTNAVKCRHASLAHSLAWMLELLAAFSQCQTSKGKLILPSCCGPILI